MKQQLLIRDAVHSDVPKIVEFAVALAEESEQIRLDEEVVARGAHGFIDNPRFGFYLVAESDGQIAGSVMIIYEYSDWRDGVYWWVQSVFVDGEFRRRGIYRALYEEVKARACRQGNVRGFRLYVANHNRRARKVYRNMGMRETCYQVMEEPPAPKDSPVPA